MDKVNRFIPWTNNVDIKPIILLVIYKKWRQRRGSVSGPTSLPDFLLLPLSVDVVSRSRDDRVFVVRPHGVFPAEFPLPDEARVGVCPGPVDRLRDAEEVGAQSVVLARWNG